MASDEINVAIVALIISLIALVVTISQLLAQSFATAEGSRRCSKAVIGHCNSLTLLEKNYKNPPTNDNERMQRWERTHDLYDETTKYFQDIIRKQKDFYLNLLGNNKPPPRDLDENDHGHKWRSEQVNMMWDKIPHYVSFIAGCDSRPDSICKDAALVEEAWITLYIRGLCWAALNTQYNSPDRDFFIPSKYYGSQLPIFLL